MKRAFRFAVVLMALGFASTPARAQAAGPRATAALARALASTGRAEATLRYEVELPGGGVRVVHAALALEPPARARIDVPGSGERLVSRADGGEWLQPATRQLLRFRAQQAAALRWWRVLIDPGAPGHDVRERASGQGRWVLTLLSPHGAPTDSAEVWLDAHGLPARLVVPAGDPQGARYRLNGWRFTHPRGEAAFRLALPAGYEAVDMP